MLPLLLLLFSGAIISFFAARIFRKIAGILLSVLPALAFVYLLYSYSEVGRNLAVTSNYAWASELNIHLSFYMDGLSLLFSLLITGIGALILIYSNGYMKSHHHHGRFYAFMFLFMGSMLGVVLAGNVITLYVFWALTSLSSFLLIGFYNEKKESRTAALQALLITELGGLSLLAGLIMMGSIAGTYEISTLLSSRDVLVNHHLYGAMVVLILLGAFTKSAQVPFHFWLPAAMQAPTPVSAYLHSATMVKAGIYLLLRLTPVTGNTEMWRTILVITGTVTMFFGVYTAVGQKDLKKILAYATISSLGLMVLLTGIGTNLSLKAALLYLFAHALFKGALFMVAGTVDKATGTRNIGSLSGLWNKLKVTTPVAFLALLSMAGLPPMLGYVGKELFYDATLHTSRISVFVLVISVLSNSLMFLVSAIIAYEVFFGKSREKDIQVHPTGFLFMAGPAILAILSVGIALFPGRVEPLLEYALRSAGMIADVQIEMWHGVNPVFLLSVATIALGITLFIFRKAVLQILAKIDSSPINFSLSHLFNKVLNAFLRMAKKSTRIVQHGFLRIYLLTVLGSASLLIWLLFAQNVKITFFGNLTPVSFYVLGIALLTISAAVATVFTQKKLTAIVTMGVVGYGISLFYMFYGAVDLAITQVLVETLTLVLFVLVVYKLPQFELFSPLRSRVRDAVVAITMGFAVAALTLIAGIPDVENPVSEYLVNNSFEKAHGKNVVNLILVDFRAFDTMGEVTVLVIAAVGIISLLKTKNKNT